MDGDDLYRVVEAYESLGIHRAGTAVDRATFDWYERHLQSFGLTTGRSAVPFDRYDVESSLTADGVAIEHLPLFYEWIGSIETTSVDVVGVDPVGRGFHRPNAEAPVTGDGEAVALATAHPDGLLVASNREIGDRGGRPTVLIGSRDHPRLADAHDVTLRMNAHLAPATTENLIARNDRPGEPLLLTTPLSGWFQCSGERGTGAAVLLGLIERFADRPLLVLATGGHELGYFGVREWVAAGGEPVAAIAHIGASVACDEVTADGTRRLVSRRIARTDASGATADTMRAALEQANFHVVDETDSWGGEAEVLCDLGVPMLSVTGAGAEFHTPEDRTAHVTSAGSLALTRDAIGDALAALVSSLR